MKKNLTLLVFAVLFAVPAFARYIVVLKDGTRYAAKAKWTVVKGKALVLLENGQALQFDPSLIDVAKSEAMTKIGSAQADIIDLNPATSPAAKQAPQASLGSQIKLRTREQQEAAKNPAPAATTVPAVAGGTGVMPDIVIDKFDRAYDNVGIYEKSVKSSGGRAIRAELTVDTEERVFNAISATSFLMVRNAGVEGQQIDIVELFMKTTNGGSAGRFQMTRADAEALDKRTISQQEYFVKKVIY
ncbi:MAG TPA: hypothetical protein VEK57_31040 [Thermoanaerobaculia bacterium]|nr:hypothetical protein [Thermoanaerobaculia bacterium]